MRQYCSTFSITTGDYSTHLSREPLFAKAFPGLWVMLMPVSSIFQSLAGLLSKSAFSVTLLSAEKYFAIFKGVMVWCLTDNVASGVLIKKDGFRMWFHVSPPHL